MVNRDNYRLARSYLSYLSEIVQLDPDTVDRYWFYLRHLLLWADATPFNSVQDISLAFPAYLATARLDGKDGMLSHSSLRKIAQTSKRFLLWAKMTRPREFRKLPIGWIDALRPPRHIQPMHEHVFVTLDEMKQIAALEIPEGNLALRRDQAGAAMLFVSGMRAGALGSLPIEAVDLPNLTVKQWTSLGVATKNSKSATTYLLNIPELLAVVEQWDAFIRERLPPSAAWFTPIISQWGEQRVSAEAVTCNRNARIIKRMRKLFAAANLPYKSPHKFRHGHAVYALQRAKTMADYKAVSMNLMHEDIRVTDGIYAPLISDEVRQRVAQLAGQPSLRSAANGDLAELIRKMPDAQLSEMLVAIAERVAG